MAGGAGMHRGGYGGNNNNGSSNGPNNQQGQQYNAGPPQQQPPPYNQYGGQGPPTQQQQGQGQKPRSGGFDGPGEPSRGPNPYSPGLGYDPAKPKPVAEKVISNTRIELPASAYRLEGPSVS